MAINPNILFSGGLVSPVSSYAKGRQSREESQGRQIDIAKGLADIEEAESLRGLAGAYGTDQFIPEAIGASPDVARQVALQQSAAQAKGRFGGSGTFNVQYPLIDVPGQPGTQQYHQFKTDPRTGEPIMTAIPGAFKKTSKLEKIADPDTGRITRFNLITGESFKTNFYDPNVVMGNKKLAAQLSRDKVNEIQSKMTIAKEAAKQKADQVGYQADYDNNMITANRALNTIDMMIGNKDKKLNPHPGFKDAVGVKGSALMFGLKEEPVAGSDAAGFMALYNQVTGEAFLQAFESIKGGGQITEMEGQKATQALTDMNVATSERQFIQAANRFRTQLKRGLELSRKKKKGLMTPSVITPTPVTGLDVDSIIQTPQIPSGINLNGIDPKGLE